MDSPVLVAGLSLLKQLLEFSLHDINAEACFFYINGILFKLLGLTHFNLIRYSRLS